MAKQYQTPFNCVINEQGSRQYPSLFNAFINEQQAAVQAKSLPPSALKRNTYSNMNTLLTR